MGYGWWCWIIPLKGGDFSVGLVYDSRLFKLPEGASLGERLHEHIRGHPVGREIFREAKAIEHDARAFSALPYHSAQVCGEGWAIAGDAAGFIDPLYSPGLDFCAYTTSTVSDLVTRSLGGKKRRPSGAITMSILSPPTGAGSRRSIRTNISTWAKADLMSAAFLLDVGTYFIGLVRPAYANPECAFLQLPFGGAAGRIFAVMMKFYNRRLVVLAKNRIAHGATGMRTRAGVEFYDGFVPDFRVHKLVRKGLFRWWGAELRNLRFLFASRKHAPGTAAPAAATVEA